MHYNPNHIMAEIVLWSEAKTHYEIAYNNAVTYDDRGSKEFAEEMIAYSQKRVNELETKLITLKKGA